MNKTRKLIAILVGLGQFLAVGAANADVVTFGSTPVAFTKGSFSVDGFSFFTSHPVPGAFQTVTNTSSYVGAHDGYYLAYYAPNGNFETFSAAAPFNLTSIDLGGGYQFGSAAQSLAVTGFHADGSMVTTNLMVAPSFSTFALSGFDNLTSVRLGSLATGYVTVDNIITTPVPEPETYALLLAGLGLLAVVGRRRKTLG